MQRPRKRGLCFLWGRVGGGRCGLQRYKSGMRIVNESSSTKLKTIRKLVKFVEKRFRFSYFAYLHLCDKDPNWGNMIGGTADKLSGTEFAILNFTPSVVILWLHEKSNAPFGTTHRKSLGKVIINSWEEEFVLVLAHELRHIDQFWGASFPKHYEVDAERFAIGVLNEYRVSQGLPESQPIPFKKRPVATRNSTLRRAARKS